MQQHVLILHPNFKFTLNQYKNEIPFLVVKVTNTDKGLQTSIYTKPRDKALYKNPPHSL